MTSPLPTIGYILNGVRLKMVDKKLPSRIRSSYSDKDLVIFLLNGVMRMERKQRNAFYGMMGKLPAFKRALAVAGVSAGDLDITMAGSDPLIPGDTDNAGTILGDRIVPILFDFVGALMSSVALEAQSLPEQGVRPAVQIPPTQEESPSGVVEG